MTRRYLLGIMTAVALVTVACGSDSGSPPTQSEEGLDEVTLVLDYLMDGNKAPFVLGREKGFFEDEGIDVTSIEESGGSDEAAKLVGNGRFDFGTAYATDYSIAVDKGVPITMVANYQPLDQAVIFVRDDSDIQELTDLEGKNVIIGSDESRILLENVLTEAGADVGQITIEEVDAEQRNGLFLQNRADAMKGPFETIASMQDVDPSLQVRVFPYADYGFNTMSQGLFTHNDMIESNPDLVGRMTDAAMKSYRYAAEHPEEVLEVVPDLYPEAKPQILETEMNIAFALVATENTSGQPFGYMAPEDWASTLEVLTSGEVISGDKPAEEFYTNDFIGDWEPLEPQGEFAELLGGG
jgi:NitT/TauT family transport system substrate-binding protein